MGRCFGPLFWRKRPGASPGACYLSSRSMTAARARTRLGSGAWGCRPFAIGSSGSISGGRMASSTASRPGIPRNSMTSKGARLVAMVEAGPTPAVHGVVRWRLIDLAQWVFDEYRISVTKQILSRELRALGYRKLSARPRHHAHDEAAVAAFKKKVPDILATIAATSGKPLDLWCQDEARIGQKNKVTRCWAERGTRPFALKDQRTASAYIFGAICPALGKAASLVLPSCNTEALTLHLQEIALAVEPGAHAVLFVDQAGWACHREAGRARKHHARPAAVQVTRAKSSREHLAIHARQLALQPDLHQL